MALPFAALAVLSGADGAAWGAVLPLLEHPAKTVVSRQAVVPTLLLVYGVIIIEEVFQIIEELLEKVSSTFDGFNRLKLLEKVKGGERANVDFVYNGDGLRTLKTVQSSKDGSAEKVTNYLYDHQHVILETDGADAV